MSESVESPIHLEKNNQKTSWTRPYFSLFTGQAFSLLGSQIVQFALIWWLTRETGSATVLATASVAGLLPQVFLSPIAGALVDRWNRRLTMLAADGSVALATLALVYLFFSGKIEIWHVYLLLFFRSTAGSFHWPAMQASSSLMVPEQKLAQIQGLNQLLQGGLNIAAAPLGALLVEALPMHAVMSIDIFTALLAVCILFFIHIPQPEAEEKSPSEKNSVWEDFKAGLGYIWAWPGLVIIICMAALINLLLTPGLMLMPILVTRHFDGQAFELALMQSSLGVGMMTGGLLLSVWGGFRKRVMTSLLGLLWMGLGALAVGLMPASAFRPALLAVFALGFCGPIVDGPLFAALQSVVAPEMQGRVFTVVLSASSAMAPLGLVLSGPIADTLGVQVWFIASGIMMLLMGSAAMFIPAVLTFEQEPRAISVHQPSKQPAPTYGD